MIKMLPGLKIFKSKDWWINFTAGVVATIAGITLTVGVDDYLNDRKQKNEVEKLLNLTFKDLSERTENIMGVISDLIEQDSIMQTVNERFRNNPLDLTPAMATEFCEAANTFIILDNDQSIQQMFMGSYQSWQVLDDMEVTIKLGDCFDLLSMMETNILESYNRLREIWTEINDRQFIMDKSEEEITRILLSTPSFRYYLDDRRYILKMLEERSEELCDREKELETYMSHR